MWRNVFLLGVLGCGWTGLAAGRGPEALARTTSFAPVVGEFASDVQAVARAFDVPWSDAALAREEALLDSWRTRLDQSDFEALEPAGRVDWLLLGNHLASEKDRLALDRARLAELAEGLPFRASLHQLETGRWRNETVDPRAAATVLDDAARAVREVRRRLDKGRDSQDDKNPATPLVLSPVIAVRMASVVDALRQSLKEWFSFYDGFVPEFSWWVRQPHQALDTLLEGHAKHLRTDLAGLKGEPEDPLIGDPVGAEALARQAASEWLPAAPEALIEIGEKEFAWCEAEMRKVAAEMGCGDDVKAALAKMKALHVTPGGQASVVVEEAEKAIAFLKERSLLTIPPLCEETWRLEMLSPEAQRTLPYAVYSAPHMMVAYAHDSMGHEDKLMSMRGNNRPSLHIVTPHEVIPGHHLQAFMARRHQPHRQIFSTPFLVEGWALYWEMRLWDLGYGSTPEERAGMLFWRLHRCARIIVSLKFHLGKMSPPEMIDFLVTRVGHEKSAATSEVRRYINGSYGPLYQAAYMIGGLQLRSLHAETVGTGTMSERQFHDTVLAQGPIPIALIRAALLGEPLTRDWKPRP